MLAPPPPATAQNTHCPAVHIVTGPPLFLLLLRLCRLLDTKGAVVLPGVDPAWQC